MTELPPTQAFFESALYVRNLHEITRLDDKIVNRTREAERLRHSLAKGHPLEFEIEPKPKKTIGLTYVQPGSHPALPRSALAVDGPSQCPPKRSIATLWNVWRPSASSGLNSSLSATDGTFEGLSNEGYVDLSKNLYLDYSFNARPGGAVSGDVELTAQLPKLLPQGTPLLLSHKLDVHGSWQGQLSSSTASISQHRTAVKVPLSGSKSQARVEVKMCPAEQRLALSLDVGPKADKKLTSANGNSSGNGGSNKEGALLNGLSDGDDSDDDNENVPALSGDLGQIHATPGSSPQPPPLQSKSGAKFPAVKLEVLPATPSQQQTYTATWRQTWTSALRSNVCYRSTSNQVTVDVRGSPAQGLQLSGAVVATAGAPLASSTLHRMTGRLKYRTKYSPGGRRILQAQSSISGSDGGATHSLKFQQQRPAEDMQGSVEVTVTPSQGKTAVKFELSVPF